MIRRLLKALSRNRRGAIAIEVALATPVLVTLLLSGVEVTHYVLLNQKLEHASATMADLVSQAQTLSDADLAELFYAAEDTVQPFDLADDGRIIVSSISKSPGAVPSIVWQRSFGAGSGSSTFGVEGGNAVLPAGFVMNDGDDVIVGEAFFNFVPIFGGDLLGSTTLHAYAILRPRYGPLTTPPS